MPERQDDEVGAHHHPRQEVVLARDGGVLDALAAAHEVGELGERLVERHEAVRVLGAAAVEQAAQPRGHPREDRGRHVLLAVQRLDHRRAEEGRDLGQRVLPAQVAAERVDEADLRVHQLARLGAHPARSGRARRRRAVARPVVGPRGGGSRGAAARARSCTLAERKAASCASLPGRRASRA
jgi:hypothetical protein